MAKIIKPLNQAQVLALKPREKPYFTAVDSNGLYVQTRPTGKSWVMRVTSGKSRSWKALGDVNSVSLSAARQAVSGIKLTQPDIPKNIPLPTFKKQAMDFIEDLGNQLKNDKNLKQWSSTMKEFAFPIIGNKPIDLITPSDIKDIVNTILPRLDTAKKMRSRIERIIDSAWVEHRTGELYINPASSKIINVLAKGITKRAKVNHHLAVPVEDAPKIFQECWEKVPYTVGYAALCFTILTIGRSGMGVNARWDQIKKDQWIIEGEQMKTGVDHVCPLSKQALELLELRKIIEKGKDNGWVFPSPVTRAVMSTDSVLNCLQRTCGTKYTTHGWRTTFKQWAAEKGDSGDDYLLSELALAHKVGDKTQQAYFRTTLYKKRQKQNQDWADFLFNDVKQI